MYGLALHESQMNEVDRQYLDVVQGRLIKAWFGISKLYGMVWYGMVWYGMVFIHSTSVYIVHSTDNTGC